MRFTSAAVMSSSHPCRHYKAPQVGAASVAIWVAIARPSTPSVDRADGAADPCRRAIIGPRALPERPGDIVSSVEVSSSRFVADEPGSRHRPVVSAGCSAKESTCPDTPLLREFSC
jgi:hypothetical protein